MVLGSVVALQGSAAAAPSNLTDIDVAHVGNTLYVAAGVTGGGSLQVQPMVCASGNTTCSRQGWTTVGQGVAYAEIHALDRNMVVLVARLTNGRTWYKRGSCEGVRCTWYSWHSLGGNVISVRAQNDGSYNGCVSIAGLSPKRGVYKARVCRDQIDYGWKYIGGKMKQIAVDASGSVFGVTPNYTLWWHPSGREYSATWTPGGGRISQPVIDNARSNGYCGLSSTKQLWCFDKSDLTWSRAGGKWRKLDNGQSIGLSTGGSLWARLDRSRLDGYGGNLNQVAWDYRLQVGVSGSMKPWYRFTSSSDNTWNPA